VEDKLGIHVCQQLSNESDAAKGEDTRAHTPVACVRGARKFSLTSTPLEITFCLREVGLAGFTHIRGFAVLACCLSSDARQSDNRTHKSVNKP
jgi:hypothetical protein